jgi:hypothetical protein
VTGGGIDRLGVLQVLGGIALSLIALFSAYAHVSICGRTIALQQQWGIPFIAASLATIVVVAEGCCEAVAQLASGSRLRAAQDVARRADEAARERNLAGRERSQADRERNRAAEERERQAEAEASQAESLEDIRRAIFLSARVQLDPTGSKRARLQAFLTPMGERHLGHPTRALPGL